MTIIADENIDGFLVRRLRSDGHDVTWITEVDPSIEDPLVLELADVSNALLITEDKGFGRLIFSLGFSSCGVLLLRVHELDFIQRAAKIAELIESMGTDLLRNVTVVSDSAIRSHRIS